MSMRGWFVLISEVVSPLASTSGSRWSSPSLQIFLMMA